MPRITYDYANLTKNGVTEAEIDDIFESDLTIALEIAPSERGNNRAMIIGWTLIGRLLEIGVEYFDDQDWEHIFHAINAGVKYRKEFEKRL